VTGKINPQGKSDRCRALVITILGVRPCPKNSLLSSLKTWDFKMVYHDIHYAEGITNTC
jgi:hypothetical protein